MVSGGAKEQTKRALASLKAVLKAAGTSEKNVAKTTVFIKEASMFKEMNDAYANFFRQAQAR